MRENAGAPADSCQGCDRKRQQRRRQKGGGGGEEEAQEEIDRLGHPGRPL